MRERKEKEGDAGEREQPWVGGNLLVAGRYYGWSSGKEEAIDRERALLCVFLGDRGAAP